MLLDGQHRPRAARRARGDPARRHGRARASGPAGSARGTSTAPTSRPAAARPPGACSGCRPARCASCGRRRFPLGLHLIEGVSRSARNYESMARQREALAALGTLAAGLAHELNNPAAAATRAVDALGEAYEEMLSSLRRLAAAPITAEQFAALDALRQELEPAAGRRPDGPRRPRGRPVGLAGRHGVTRDWVLAPALAGGRRRRRLVRAGRRGAGRRPGSSRGWSGWPAPCPRPDCWRRSRSPPGASPTWSRPSSPTPSSTAPPCSRPTSPRGWRAPW